MLFAKQGFSAAPAAVLEQFQRRVERDTPGLEAARNWLVFAGQIEQAVRDAGGPGEAETLTGRAAELFLALRRGGDAAEGRRRLLAACRALRLGTEPVAFRIPEGFAWYALYPDSYAEASARWADARQGTRVLVIGLRSIGTSLSAAVAAALAQAGVEVAARITLRPDGHPFARRARLPAGLPVADAAVIVDEGPGLSGSSMAAVAEAVLAAGMKAEAISFFPGHARGPGAEADDGVRRWWQPERCFVAAPPAIAAEEGSGLSWLFGGLAAVNAQLDTLAEVKRARQQALAARGLALPSPAAQDGWIAIAGDGVALTRSDLSEALMRNTLAPYVTAASRRADDPEAVARGLKRIAAALGLPVPGHVADLCRSMRLAGDGRMGPGQWLRRCDGAVLKRDATGTDCEHTWQGQQCVLWDAGAASAEWEMDEGARALWMRCLRDAGITADEQAMAFHEAGHCALELARARHAGEHGLARRYDHLLHAALARMAVAA